MFRWCEKVFEGADGEIEEFKQGLSEIMEYMTPGETVYDNYVSLVLPSTVLSCYKYSQV